MESQFFYDRAVSASETEGKEIPKSVISKRKEGGGVKSTI